MLSKLKNNKNESFSFIRRFKIILSTHFANTATWNNSVWSINLIFSCRQDDDLMPSLASGNM